MKLARAGGGGGNKNLLFAAPRPGYIGLSAYTLFPDFMLQCFSCEAKRFMSFARESWSVPYYLHDNTDCTSLTVSTTGKRLGALACVMLSSQDN